MPQWSNTSGLTLQNALSTGADAGHYYPSGYNTRLLPLLRDTWQLSIGSSIMMNDRWLLRAGFGYDQSPIANNRNRFPFLPDSNTYNLGLGTHYQFNQAFGMDLGWMHTFVNKAGIDSFQTADAFQTSTADGKSMDMFGVQMSWAFV